MSNSAVAHADSEAIQMARGDSSPLHHRWALGMLQKLQAKPSDSILDVGAGQGHLLHMLDAAGFLKLTGIDALPAPANTKFNWKLADLNKFEQANTWTPVEWITCTEVIEHLENPRHLLRTLHGLLQPGGRLLLSTPNVESLRSILSLIFRSHFVDFLDTSYPAHITPVLKMDLERMLKEIGFELEAMNYSDVGVLPHFTNFTWQGVSGNLLAGKFFSDHLFVVARKK